MHENKTFILSPTTSMTSPDPSLATIDEVKLPLLEQKGIMLHILRLDKVHPIVSGNKCFKLKEHLRAAISSGADRIITFGGAWSNHIIAAAYAARDAGIPITGIIRGEKPDHLSDTLIAAMEYGIQLEFISRKMYAAKEDTAFLRDLSARYPGAYIVPEGGAGMPGIRGSEGILAHADKTIYSHILCAIGTGTTYLGLANAASLEQKIIGIPVLRGMNNLSAITRDGLPPPEKVNNCKIIPDYHFGGYARKSAGLLTFMNSFYRDTHIPSDFVYTGKLFYAVIDMIKKGAFSAGSRLLVIHSGGLQGNLSLSPGALDF